MHNKIKIGLKAAFVGRPLYLVNAIKKRHLRRRFNEPIVVEVGEH